jgi:hypothetical protein
LEAGFPGLVDMSILGTEGLWVVGMPRSPRDFWQ